MVLSVRLLQTAVSNKIHNYSCLNGRSMKRDETEGLGLSIGHTLRGRLPLLSASLILYSKFLLGLSCCSLQRVSLPYMEE